MTIVYQHKDGRLEIYAQVMENLVHFSDKQVAQVQEMIGTDLRNRQLPEAYVQRMIVQHGASLTKELAAVFQARVNEFNDVIVRRVKVDRTHPEKVIQALEPRCNKGHSLRNMPAVEGEETDVYIFRAPENPDTSDILLALKHHGLKPDPLALAQANLDDPELAKMYPNGTIWTLQSGDTCNRDWDYIRFRDDQVRSGDNYCRWGSGWYIGGVLA